MAEEKRKKIELSKARAIGIVVIVTILVVLVFLLGVNIGGLKTGELCTNIIEEFCVCQIP